MGVDIAGLCGIMAFYVLILVVGIIVARIKSRRQTKNSVSEAETVITAGRELGYFVGTLTMTATWVGGGYINGTAEKIFTEGMGFVWTLAPIGYTISIVLNGLFFAERMREKRYMTMLDPFQERYGPIVGGLMFLPALFGDLLWSAAILAALGSTVSIILGLSLSISVIISAAVAATYTFFGGIFSVAYTDVAQLFCLVGGLVLSIPFAWHSEYVDMNSPANTTLWSDNWLGSLPKENVGQWIDELLLLILGGMPWQAYFQRVLSAKSAKAAKITSLVSSVGILALSIPPIIVGVIAKHTDWEAAGFSYERLVDYPTLTMPAVLAFLTPKAVAFFGLGAIAAAVMSSADSSMLSASSMFSYNIYKNVIRPKASDREIIVVLRASVVVCAVIASVIAIKVSTVYGLFILCSDLVFVILFPQLFLVLYTSFTNSYGVLIGCTLALLLRTLGGEPLFGYVNPVIKYPFYHLLPDVPVQRFPFKTLSMLVNLVVTVVISLLVRWLFAGSNLLPLKYDALKCFTKQQDEEQEPVQECSVELIEHSAKVME